jgi:hypothetical protein
MKGANQDWKQYALQLAEQMKPLKFGDMSKIFKKTKENFPSVNYYSLVASLQQKGFKTFVKGANKSKKAGRYVIAKVKGNKIVGILEELTKEDALAIWRKGIGE